MKSDLEIKYEKLQQILLEARSAVIAFSGGTDSTFLLKTAHEIMGEKVIAATAAASSFPERERKETIKFCQEQGIIQILYPFRELEIEGFRMNPPNRCYLCKHAMFEGILHIADEHGVCRVMEGSNLDDREDYRPGLAALKELGISSPLQEAGLFKSEIRELSKKIGLPTWDKPSFSCLSTRFAYGEPIREENLKKVDQAEQILLDLGFHQVRVRFHGSLARIEILPQEFESLLKKEIVSQVTEKFKALGFTYVTLDLLGYRSGSMNEGL